MPTARRRRTSATAAIGASALAQLGLLVALLLYKPVLVAPQEPSGPPVAIIPILLLPRTPPAAAGGPVQGELRLHRRAQRQASLPPPVAPLVTAAPVADAPAKALSPAAPSISASGPSASGPDLRTALRRSAVGCANRAGLSRTERDVCDERLGRGAAAEAYIPTPLEPRIRAYYDAVAKAKAPDGQPVPQRATGSLGMFDIDPRGVSGHGPGIGCKIPFGPGQKKKLPSNWLTLGPCYIAPPQGPLSVEADITPP